MASFSFEMKKYLPFVGFLLIVGVFIFFKLPHLPLPYFWDEAWVYAPAVSHLYHHQLSMLPDAMPVDLSRGHPLLFHFLAASWQKIFGASITSAHAFALFVSVMLLSVLFYLGNKISGIVGLSVVILLCLQPVFISQSGLLLPEVMVSLWILLSPVFYLNENKIGFVFSATCLLLTKEPGIIFLFAIGVWILVEHLSLRKQQQFSLKKLAMDIIIVVLPVLFASSFFIIQKMQHGWFFYPEHISYIEFDWKHFKELFHAAHQYVFEKHAREPLALGFLIITITFWKALRFRERILIAFCFLAVTKIFFELWKMPKQMEYFILPFLLVLIYHKFFFRMYSENKIKGRLIGIASLFGIIYLAFSSLNFLSIRYLLCVLPLFILTAVIFSEHVISSLKVLPLKSDFIIALLVAICGLNMYSKLHDPIDIRDDNLNFADGIRIQQDIVRYFESNNLSDCHIYGTFLNVVNLTNPASGYLSKDNTFAASSGIEAETDYFIFTNIEESPIYKEVKNEQVNIEKRFQQGKAWAEIYRRTNSTCSRM